MNDCVMETIFFTPTNELEVYNTFMSLINSKSCDIDNLQVKPVKFVVDIIPPCVVHIFNLALLSGEFPSRI